MRGWTSRLTIRQQLGLTTSISLLLFFGSLLLFAHTTNRLLGSLYQSHRLEETMAVARNLRRLAPGIETSVSAYVVSGRSEFLLSYQAAHLAYQYDVERIYALLADYPDERRRFEDVLGHAEEWNVRYAAHSLYLRRSGTPAQAAEARRLLESPEARAALSRFINELDLFLEWQQERLIELRAGAEADVRRMIYLALFLGVLGTLGTLWWTSWLARALTRPLTALLRAGERVESGAVPEPLAFDRPAEIVQLGGIFNRTAQVLTRARLELETFENFVEHSPRQQGAAEIRRFFFDTVRAHLEPEQALVAASDAPAGLLEVVDRLAPAAADAPSVMTQPTACPAIRSSKPFCVADTARQQVCRCELEVPRAPAAAGYLCLPLLYEGSLSGLVCLTGAAGHWNEERRAQAARYAAHLARELAVHERLAHAQRQAMVDELTGLYNRRFGEEYLRKLVALGRRFHRPFALLILDLDHFKSFNDAFGHLAGDRLLRAFAAALMRPMRQSALAARWGGEEFLVILPETDSEGALRVAERLRAAIAQVRLEETPATPVTVSIGAAVFPQHGGDEAEILSAADRALYRAKRAGRDRVELASVPRLAEQLTTDD
ncbi:MAG: diguanylate cyclase [Candidatus Acidiferrales bacterium]